MAGSQGSVVTPLSPATTALLSRPQSPPVLAVVTSSSCRLQQRDYDDADDDALTCHACRAVSSIRTDWSQGDRVCTCCGVVHTQHLLDAGPEWRDYGDNDDSGNAGSKARSGLVVTDETKYVGGLQPTLVSRQIFGRSAVGSSHGTTSNSDIAQRLNKANRRMDKLMERRHKTAFANAALNLKLMRKRQQQQQIAAASEMVQDTTDTDTINTDTVATVDYDVEPDYGSSVVWMEERPEFEKQLLEQEQQVARQQQALYADKWSLDRAKQLHAMSDDAAGAAATLEPPLDETLQTAARDLYTCYQMLVQAANTLQLPVTITDEAAALLSQYAARRDGIKVKGVASSTTTPSTSSSLKLKSPPLLRNAASWKPGSTGVTKRLLGGKQLANVATTKKDVEERHHQLRDANKLRQMGALCAALLFWTARNRQRPRSLVAVCDSISSTEKVQRKHCSRAMNELKEYFPELARVSTTSAALLASSAIQQEQQQQHQQTSTFPVPHAISVKKESGVDNIKQDGTTLTSAAAASVANFTEHALSKLNLPPVAEASIRYLVFYHLDRFSQLDDCTTALPTVCAAYSYFVCRAGSTMQQLASQAQADTTNKVKKRPSSLWSRSESKRAKVAFDVAATDTVEQPFDLFADPVSGSTRSAVVTSSFLAEQRAYEMRRMWDAWAEQMPWSRTLILVEQSTGVSRNVIWDYYKQHLFPDRSKLLGVVRDATLSDAENVTKPGEQEARHASSHELERAILRGTPLASVLLPHVSVAAPLMKADSKV